MRVIRLDPRLARPARALRFAADGRGLAAVVGKPGPPGEPVRFDFRSDLARPLLAPDPSYEASDNDPDPAVGPDSELVAEVRGDAGRRSLLRLVDTREQPPRVRAVAAGGAEESFTAVGFAADGGTLYAGLVDYADDDPADGLRVARLDTAAWLDDGRPEMEVETLPADPYTRATAFADTPAGLLAVATTAGTAVIFELIGGRALAVEHLPGQTDPPPVRDVLFSPDGRLLATVGSGAVAVWDALTGRRLASVAAPRPLTAAAFAPDGGLLAACLDGSVRRFHPGRFDPADRFDFRRGPLHGVAVAPDGLTAAAGTATGLAVLWDL